MPRFGCFGTRLAPVLAEGGTTSGIARNNIFYYSAYCLGTIKDAGSNIQYPRPFLGCTKTIPVVDPKLDPAGLKDNGGPTQTVALLLGSPAIDNVPLAMCTDTDGRPLKVDQRGFPRPAPGHMACDSGAYEFQGP